MLPDTDEDDVPDEWETFHGLNLHDPSDARSDADGDGLPNLAEYQSGTSATNAARGLKLQTVRARPCLPCWLNWTAPNRFFRLRAE